MHELLREAGAFAVSLLAGDQAAVAQHFARGVPPIALWHGIASAARRRRAAARRRARLARVPAGGRASRGRPHGLRRRGATGSRAASRAAARPCRRGTGTVSVGSTELTTTEVPALPAPEREMIRAVVFDLDGVLIQTEELWDEVRESLARAAGGRYGEEEQRAMMGMSSPEWSRYMHEHVGLPESPDEIAAEVVRRMVGALPGAAPADRRRDRGGRAPGRALAARRRLVLEPRADRPGARALGPRPPLSRDRVVGGGRPRQARARRLPGGVPPPRASSPRGPRRSRTATPESGRPKRRGCASWRSRTRPTPRTTRRSPTQTSC